MTADFSGNYETISGVSTKAHTYTFGPVFTARQNDGLQPFVHALLGGFHAAATFGGLSGSTNAFAMAPGIGVDAIVNKHFALRLAQADWVLLRAEGVTEKKNMRRSSGIVFRF